MVQTSDKQKILIADDEETIRNLLCDTLRTDGYDVRSVANGQEAIKEFFAWRPDLVVMDIMMPKLDGWGLLERIREVSEVPIIVFTALGQEHHVVRGLRGGAVDYVVKPIRLDEFRARVETALRTTGKATKAEPVFYQDSTIYVDYLQHRVFLRGQEVELSPLEFRILAALVRNPGTVLSIDRLLDLCWGDAGGPENVRVYISFLRKKLETDPRRPSLIETVREFGYRYRSPDA